MPKKPERPTGFAGQLKRLREAAGLTQGQLAERAGYHAFTVAKLEQGLQEPTWPTVLALARALGVNCLAFVADEDAEPPESRGRGRPPKATASGEATPQVIRSRPGDQDGRDTGVAKPARRGPKSRGRISVEPGGG